MTMRTLGCFIQSLALGAWMAAAGSLVAQDAAPNAAPQEKPILDTFSLNGATVYREEFERRLSELVDKPFDEAKLREVIIGMIEKYQNDGYHYVKVIDVNPRKIGDDYYPSITINEGRIKEIHIEGTERTRNEVVIHQLLFAPGDIYREDDKDESERLLRTRPYIGYARIDSEADEDNNVIVTVHIQDLWSVVPRMRFVGGNDATLKDVLDGNVGFQASVLDYNLFGSGQSLTMRYRWDIRERGADGTPLNEKSGRHLLGFHLLEPNLFQSRWQMETEFQQLSQTDFNAWEFRLSHPFYSLKTRWAFDIHALETASIDEVYYESNLLRTWERRIGAQYLSATRSYGPPNAQVRLAFWTFHQEANYKLLYSKLPVVDTAAIWASEKAGAEPRVTPSTLPTERQALAGTDVTWQQVRYVEDYELDRLGRVEDVPLGRVATLSLGGGTRALENDHDEIRPGMYYYWLRRGKSRWLWHGRATATMPYIIRNEKGNREGWQNHLFQFQSRLFLRDKNLPTLVARLEASSVNRMTNDFELFLDGSTGIRGYPRYSFDGMHRFVFNLETRKVLYRHPWGVLQGAAFADRGYIWRNDFGGPKRSVGVGLRIGLLRFAESPILRFDAVYPLDKAQRGWGLSFGTGQYF